MQSEKQINEHTDKVMLGIISGALAFAFFAGNSACVKLLVGTHHVVEIAFYRNLFIVIPMFLFLVTRKRYDWLIPLQPRLLGVRILIGVTGMIVTFQAFEYLPISDATVLFMASTLIVPIIAIFILGERMGIYRWLAIIIGFLGVFLAAAPSGQVSLIGVCFAVGAAFAHATIQTILRLLKNEAVFTTAFYFAVGGVVLPSLFMPWLSAPILPHEWTTFLLLALSGGLGQYFLAMGFKYAPATVVAPFNYTGLLWASFFDFIIWHYVPGWPIFLGGAIIIGAKLFIIHREHQIEKRKAIVENAIFP